MPIGMRNDAMLNKNNEKTVKNEFNEQKIGEKKSR